MRFLRENSRWLAGGFLLTFFSSFGQTFFISLSAGEIREVYELSHGQWGSIYMLATLGSALCLPWVGQIVDYLSVWRVALGTVLALATACLFMAASSHVVFLVITIFMLRIFGQGMMTHIAVTAMGKWFASQRGRAISVASIGVNVGEAAFPITFVTIAAALGWRNAWVAAAGALVVLALPSICGLMAQERTPRSSDPEAKDTDVPDWTRSQVLRDPLFYVLLLGVLAPPFIGTTIFFQQVHLVEIRGWSLQIFAASFPLMSGMVVIFALIAGQLIDRFTAVRILPVFLLPLSAACFVLGSFDGQWSAFAFMALLGVSYGFSTTLFGAVWPEIYGIAHLGAIRAAVVAIMVFATAAGPGVTGFLIDFGIPYPLQITAMGIYCLLAVMLMIVATRIAIARNTQTGTA